MQWILEFERHVLGLILYREFYILKEIGRENYSNKDDFSVHKLLETTANECPKAFLKLSMGNK